MRGETHSSSGFHRIFRHCHRLIISKAVWHFVLLVCVALIPLMIFDKPREIAIVTYVPQKPMQYRGIVEKFIKSAAGHVATHYKGGVPIYMPEETCSGCPIFRVSAEYRQIDDVMFISIITQDARKLDGYSASIIVGTISNDRLIFDSGEMTMLYIDISDVMKQ